MKHRLAIFLLDLAISPAYPKRVNRLAWAVRNRLFPAIITAQDEFVF